MDKWMKSSMGLLPYRAGSVRVTSPFGERTLLGKRAMHRGIDLVGSDKTITAVEGGVVLFSRMVAQSSGNRTWEWGNYICIQTASGHLHYYCHLSKRLVEVEDTVTMGQVIGLEGETGYSFGSHLHFEVRDKSGTSIDPTVALGIPNALGSHDAATLWYRGMVLAKCGLEAQTDAYLDRYKYAPDLWRKLWHGAYN